MTHDESPDPGPFLITEEFPPAQDAIVLELFRRMRVVPCDQTLPLANTGPHASIEFWLEWDGDGRPYRTRLRLVPTEPMLGW